MIITLMFISLNKMQNKNNSKTPHRAAHPILKMSMIENNSGVVEIY